MVVVVAVAVAMAVAVAAVVVVVGYIYDLQLYTSSVDKNIYKFVYGFI